MVRRGNGPPAGLVAEPSARHEARVGGDWHFDFDAPGERALLRGIVGVRLHLARFGFKLKLSQNHPAASAGRSSSTCRAVMPALATSHG